MRQLIPCTVSRRQFVKGSAAAATIGAFELGHTAFPPAATRSRSRSSVAADEARGTPSMRWGTIRTATSGSSSSMSTASTPATGLRGRTGAGHRRWRPAVRAEPGIGEIFAITTASSTPSRWLVQLQRVPTATRLLVSNFSHHVHGTKGFVSFDGGDAVMIQAQGYAAEATQARPGRPPDRVGRPACRSRRQSTLQRARLGR